MIVLRALIITVLGSSTFAERLPAVPSCPGAQAPPLSTSVRSKDFIEIQRSGCHADCAVYNVRVYGDGKVVWHGERFVKTVGEAHGRIPAREAKAFFEIAQRNKFWSLCGQYTSAIAGLQNTVTSVSVGGHLHTFSEYGTTAPPWLRDLDTRIDVRTARFGWRDLPKADQN